ncbi:MAG TPA: anti-sigma factor [Candidatus Acidoferrum sp.]|nr:anti-sigma factor [Candidatus Acidoferrum sp.]
MKDHQQITDDLVLYAMRELPETQAAEVRRHLNDCPSCRRDLSELNSDMGILALSSVGAAPPQRSRERLLNAVKAEPRRAKMFVMHRPWWSFVPSFAAVLLTVFGLLLWRENTGLRHRLETSQQGSAQHQADLERARLVLDALTSPQSSHFALVATKSQPVPEGRASYLQTNGTLVFTAQHLPPLPPRKIYQLWLIPASGSAPMPFGTFRPDAHGNASIILTNIGTDKQVPAKMFAVTLEPEGGSQTPTMPIIMAGA